MGDPNQPRDEKGRYSGELMHSLEHQLKLKGKDPVAAHQLAIEIMTKQGTLDPTTGQLTAKGKEREAMGRAGRRIDRMATQTGHKASEIDYRGGRARVK